MPLRKLGLGPLKFGDFEWAKTVNWWTLVWMILAAVATFAATHVVPALEDAGGFWSLATAMVVVPALRALQQWLSDNSGKVV